MQPTYLPWLGYFDLIDKSDNFIILDNVIFSKQSWQQRNRIKTSSGSLWLTVPVITKGYAHQIVCDVNIIENPKWSIKQIKTIKQNYINTPFYDYYFEELSDILLNSNKYLAELNIELIKWLCLKIGININLIRSSQLKINKAEKVENLINICNKIGTDHYLSPSGSKPYIDENNLFYESKIELSYQQYCHPEYRQLYGDFIPYMSVIDLLFNEGEKSLGIIRSGSSFK